MRLVSRKIGAVVWEYEIVMFRIDRSFKDRVQKLNELGEQGWECFTVYMNSDSTKVVYTLKRSLPTLGDHPYIGGS